MTGRRTPCLLTIVCAVLLASAGGCSQRWTFAPPGQLGLAETAPVKEPRAMVSPGAMGVPPAPASVPQASRMEASPAAYAAPQSPPQAVNGAAFVERLPPVTPLGDSFFDDAHAATASQTAYPWIPGPVVRGYGVFRRAECAFVARTGCVHPRLPEGLTELRWKVLHDQRNFYRWPASRDFLLGLAATSVLANTSMDQDFRDWVQDEARTSGTDHVADFWKGFGEGQYVIPSLVGVGLVGWLCEDELVGEYGWRASRAYLVGTPPAVFLQWALGSSRPGEKWYESSWRPFEDKNAVSGHAFIGAVPFITAAQMCEDPCGAGCFYFMSLLPAWSRINDDSHYLSQSVLGWWIAYLACRSVDQTQAEAEGRCLTVTPVCGPDTAGVAAVYAF